MYHQSKFKFAAALLVAGHCATPAIAIANTNSNGRVHWITEDDTNNDITVYNTKPGLRNGNMMTEITSVPSLCDWYYHPNIEKCVHGSEAVGYAFPNMEACCIQQFGEEGSCKWHDECLPTMSSNLRTSKSFVAHGNDDASSVSSAMAVDGDKSDGGTKSGKSKSDKSSGAKAGKATQPSCSSTQLVVVRDNLNLLVPETGTQGSTEPVILPVTDDCTIEDITVEIRIDHTFASDLEIDLVSPDSETATLVADQGGSPSSSSPIIFNDNTGVSLPGGFPAGGTYISQGEKNGVVNNMLSNITGGTFGDWTLNIFDDASGGSGTLQAVNLTIDAICCA